MTIEGDKIRALIEEYGRQKAYPEKSYIPKFCEDFDLNYIQWFSYTKEKQKPGIKILYFLMNIFPNLNLNWLLKDEGSMFSSNDNYLKVAEPGDKYVKEVSNLDLMNKLEEIHKDLKTVGVK